MAVGAFLSFEFGISGKCNTTEVEATRILPSSLVAQSGREQADFAAMHN